MTEHVSFTCGPAGSGKTLTRCAYFLADEWLPFETGPVITNFPIRVDEMCSFVSKRTGKPAEEYRDRIKFIPDEVLKAWATEEQGPEDYFRGMPLGGALIAIDECHNFLGRKHSAEHRRKWSQFCGEIRHRGARIEFLTQDESKLAGEVEYESFVKRQITASENRRDPYFKIKMSDWYEVYGSFTGTYPNKVILEEYRKAASTRWKLEHSTIYLHRPEYYRLYDSVNLPHGENEEAVKISKPQHLFERLNTVGVLLWFSRRNWFPLSTRFALCLFFLWLVGFGGINFLSAQVMERFKAVSERTAKKKQANVSQEKPPRVEPAPQRSPLPAISPAAGVDELRESVDRLRETIEKLEARESDRSTVVGFVDNVAILKSGEVIQAGDSLEVSNGVKEVVRSVDRARARVVLGSGRVLGLDRSISESQRAPDPEVAAGIGSGFGFFRSGGDNGKTRQRDGQRHSDEGLRPSPDSPNRGSDRVGGVSGPAIGDSGSDEPGTFRNSGNGRASVGLRSREGRGHVVPRKPEARRSGGFGIEDQTVEP